MAATIGPAPYGSDVARRALLTTVVAVTAIAFPVVRGQAVPAAHGESTRVAARSALSAWQAGTVTVEEAATLAIVSDGRPRLARLSIPALGLRDLRVVPYRGWTDDGPGTDIQDRGVAASPHGPRGGVGPGGLGNYQITAHRTSSTAAFRMLPSLRNGQQAVVTVDGVRFVYEIRQTRETSFRSPRSLAEQRAAVPGQPGVSPTRAFLTLSTCATQEDHAAGNFWADEFHNPEHRIDKIGVLVRQERVAAQ